MATPSRRPPRVDNARSRRRLWAALGVAAFVMTIELAGGLWSGSLALLADAGHMCTDVLGLALSLAALSLAERPPSGRHTWGFQRLEALAALLNGLILLAIAVWIAREALARLHGDNVVDHQTMIGVAAGGLAANVVGLFLLGHAHGNVNVRSAFLHVVADALGALGVLVSALIIALTGDSRADPIVSCIIAAIIAVTSVRLMVEVLGILMEAAPSPRQVQTFADALAAEAGVAAVEGLRVWSLTSGCTAVSAHLVLAAGAHDPVAVTDAAAALARARGASHVTLQPRRASPRDESRPRNPRAEPGR